MATRLAGGIPPELSALHSSLEVFDLSGNQLTGEIPIQLSDLAQLEYLDLDHQPLGHGVNSARTERSLTNLEVAGASASNQRDRRDSRVS